MATGPVNTQSCALCSTRRDPWRVAQKNSCGCSPATAIGTISMSNSVPMSPYAQQPNVDMNGLLVATCRPDQSGAYPPIYNVPHGTIQLAPGYNALPGGASWPFQMAPVAEQQGSGQDVQSVSGSYPPFGETVPSTPQRGQDARKASVPNTPNAATSGQPSVSGTAPSEQPRSGKGPATEDPTDSGESTEGRPGQRKRTLAKGEKDSKTGRRKIKIEFIDDDSRRHITFSKRKAGIMKKVGCVTYASGL